ncbi:MAG: MFS transporter [Candidatus Thorarchaeota archaeon]
MDDLPSIASFFGLEEPSPESIRLVRKFSILMPAFAVSFTISSTFWMIYIAESLGGGDYIAGLSLVGVLIVIQLIVQTLLDYPTGALGDHIGQRYIIASALICYAVAFWVTSTVTENSPFIMFVLIYVMMGFGASQESGAWEAWFDNNYRVAVPNDADRKQYGMLMGRVNFLYEIVAILVLIPGAWLALMFARTWVFQIQSVLTVFLAVVVILTVRDFPEVEEIRKRGKEEYDTSYASLLKDGVRFLVSDKFIMLSTLGTVIMFSAGTIWFQLMIFPLYFTYLLTDVAVSSFRTMAFVPNAVAQERSGIWSRKFDPVKWIPRFRFMEFCGVLFCIAVAFLTFTFPAPSGSSEILRLVIPFTDLAIIEIPNESVLPMALLLIIFGITDFFSAFGDILTQRVMIDVIPNRIRNSMYSLQPTLAIILSIPLIAFFGLFIPHYGFGYAFLLLGLISLIGALLVKKGFDYPIPKSEDIDQLVSGVDDSIP